MLALFTFVASWTNFFWPFIVLGPSNPTLPVAVQLLQAPSSRTWR
jgi:cellobiose transport system permease protein